jgi:prepilin-type N-terminal cleavage/methylation domain-containing protein
MKFSPVQSRPILTRGFTLLEMLVSLTLFTIVSTIVVGALLSLIGGNQRLIAEQTTLSNIAFAIDTMSREIRTGSGYFCADSTFLSQPTGSQDCVNGATGISIIESSGRLAGGGTGRIAYFFENRRLWRRVNNEGEQAITSADIDITSAEFFVRGATTLTAGNDIIQPFVVMVITFRADDATERTIQTTITQRALDI